MTVREVIPLAATQSPKGHPTVPYTHPMPRDDLILFRDGESVRLLAYRRGNGERYGIAKSSMDGVNWMDSTLAQGAMFDPGTDAVPITVEEARELHPNLVLPG